MLSGEAGDLWEALYSARKDERRWRSAETVLDWLRGMNEDYPPTITAPIPPPDRDWPLVDGGFPGWRASAPPEPYCIPPIPFEYLLPTTDNEAPIEALAPWWDEVVIFGPAPGPPLADLSGKKLRAGTWQYGQWSSGEHNSLVKAASLSVYPDHIRAEATLEHTTASIQGPGAIGSMVPGYAEAKRLASKASERTQQASLGGRLNLDHVAAVTFKTSFTLGAPLFGFLGGKAAKELVKARGYGECNGFELGIELSDGWRPYYVVLVDDFLPADREHEPYEFAVWLARSIATARARDPHTNELHRAALTAVAENPAPALVEQSGRDRLRRGVRVDLPGHRPVSVQLPGDGS